MDEWVLSIIGLLKDILVGFAWPLTTLIIVVSFRRELRELLQNLAAKFQFTSSIELPGGVKAFFSDERAQVIDLQAKQVVEKLKLSVDETKIPELEGQVKEVLIEQQLTDEILYLVSAQGTLSRERLYSYLIDSQSTIPTTRIDSAIETLIQAGLIGNAHGKLIATPKGVQIARTRR